MLFVQRDIFAVGGGWIGIDVDERTITVQVICDGKKPFWPLIGLPFDQRSTATARPGQAPQAMILTEPVFQ
jgi:hypothetical protein